MKTFYDFSLFQKRPWVLISKHNLAVIQNILKQYSGIVHYCSIYIYIYIDILYIYIYIYINIYIYIYIIVFTSKKVATTACFIRESSH